MSGAHFTMGGLAFAPNSLYHLAQMPALLMLLVAVQRQADSNDRPLSPPLSAWQFQPDLSYDCSGKWSSHDPTQQQSALPFLNVCCVGSVSA